MGSVLTVTTPFACSTAMKRSVKKDPTSLLVETTRSYGRNVLRGIHDYAKVHGPWLFHLPNEMPSHLIYLRSKYGAALPPHRAPRPWQSDRC